MNSGDLWLVTDYTCMADESHAIERASVNDRKSIAGNTMRRYSERMSTLSRGESSAQPIPKWWEKGKNAGSESCREQLRETMPCPSCLLGDLYYDGLFQLVCDHCGRVVETAVFT